MRNKCAAVLVLALLAQLCACSPAKTDSLPAAAKSPSASVSIPDFTPPEFETEPPPEPEPDRVQAFGETPSQSGDMCSPGRVLTSSNYTVEVYARTTERNGCQIESREYCVSDGVTASTYRATGFGNCCFFEQAVTAPGTIRYYSFQSDEWVCESLAEGSFSFPVVVVELDSGTTYFFALPRTVVLHENGSVEYLPEEDGFLYVTQTGTGFHLTVEGHGLAEGRAADALILTSPDRVLDWDVSNCA